MVNLYYKATYSNNYKPQPHSYCTLNKKVHQMKSRRIKVRVFFFLIKSELLFMIYQRIYLFLLFQLLTNLKNVYSNVYLHSLSSMDNVILLD